MEELFIPQQAAQRLDDVGCAYLLGADDNQRGCGAPRRSGSSYCPDHHALCHIPCGTTAETKRLREVEALANAVGGRRARDNRKPPRRFLRRLEQAVRDLS